MTEKQFQIVCKVIYRVTVVTLVLQVAACAMMFWMSWNRLPDNQYIPVLLGVSVLGSLVHLGSKNSFFNREEVCSGVYGTTGVMHSLGTNIYYWSFYFFFELFGVLCAVWLYIKAVWL